eukprot:172842-Pelagomonas_calceolata.AAC.7
MEMTYLEDPRRRMNRMKEHHLTACARAFKGKESSVASFPCPINFGYLSERAVQLWTDLQGLIQKSYEKVNSQEAAGGPEACGQKMVTDDKHRGLKMWTKQGVKFLKDRKGSQSCTCLRGQ